MFEVVMQVRISAAAPEADLAAAVWPGVVSVTCARVESAEHIERVDAVISRLERLRGIRPGHVAVRPMIESASGVARAAEIAASSPRMRTLELGPSITLEVGEDALDYARFECELHARASGVTLLDPFSAHD
jgi:citrate lyase subunit beta / citryl-CoA lyase